MIKVLVYLGEGERRQLAEIKIEWMEDMLDGWASYSANLAVDTGEEIKILARSFSHHREEKNVLALIDSLLSELGNEELKLSGSLNNSTPLVPWKEISTVLTNLKEVGGQ